MPVVNTSYEQWFDEHTLPTNPDTGKVDQRDAQYRECHNCGYAFKKDETALFDFKGRFFCDAKCIKENEEGLAAMRQERQFQEMRDGGY